MELDSKLEALIKKQAKYESKNLALNLLISRLQRQYSLNQSPEQLSRCVQEMKMFFEKYASIMKNDIEELKKI